MFWSTTPRRRTSCRNRRGQGHARSASSRPGATCVEMALVAPFIFLIAFGSLEFSRVLMVKQALTNAAREGCRSASLATTRSTTSCDNSVRQYLKRCFARYADQDVVTVTVTPANLDGIVSGTEITTQVEVRFSDVSWLPVTWATDARLIGTATMNRE